MHRILPLFLLLFLSCPNLTQGQVATDSTLQNKAPTYWLMGRDTLMRLSDGEQGYPVDFRKEMLERRLEQVSGAYDHEIDSIYLEREALYVKVKFNEELIATLSEQDALANRMDLVQLGAKVTEAIKKDLQREEAVKLSLKEWLIRIGYFLVSLVGLILILKLINWIFRRLNAYLSRFEKTFLKKKKNLLKYFIPRDTANIFVFIANLVRFLLLFLLLVTYLPSMFSFFPLTEDWVSTFYGYIERPVKYLFWGFVDFLPNLIFIIVIVIFTRYIVKVLRYIVDDIEEEKLVLKGFPKDWARMTQKIFSLFIYAFALVMIYPLLPGSTSPAFRGVSIFIGALLSFGSTSAVANIVAGVVITYMRAFQIGDRVKIQDTVGDVVEKSLLVTRIRTPKNEEVTIPNANIINNHLINYSAETRKDGLVLNTTVTIGYDIPWKQVEGLLLEAAYRTADIEKKPVPFVLKTSLDDYYVSYQLNAFTKKAQSMPRTYSNIHQSILEVFEEAGVEILSPSYQANRDGSVSTIPHEAEQDPKGIVEKLVDHLTGKNQKIKKSGGGDEAPSR